MSNKGAGKNWRHACLQWNTNAATQSHVSNANSVRKALPIIKYEGERSKPQRSAKVHGAEGGRRPPTCLPWAPGQCCILLVSASHCPKGAYVLLVLEKEKEHAPSSTPVIAF